MIGSAVLTRNDMLDLIVRERLVVLMRSTVFTPLTSAAPNHATRCGIDHDAFRDLR